MRRVEDGSPQSEIQEPKLAFDGAVIQQGGSVEEEETNDSPIEEVRLTVPITDDPTQQVLTFRTWVLGLAVCILLSVINKFFGFRQNPLGIGALTIQIVIPPIGKFLAVLRYRQRKSNCPLQNGSLP
ncbi:OPT super [Ancistrocladus abbreviatus]